MKFCPEANTYIQASRLIRVDGRLSIPDNNGIPQYPGTSTLKESVDAFYKDAREKWQVTESAKHDIAPHLVAGIYCCLAPEVEVEAEPPTRLNTTVVHTDIESKEAYIAACTLALETAQKDLVRHKQTTQPEEIVSPQVKAGANKLLGTSKGIGQTCSGKMPASNPQFKLVFPVEDLTASDRIVNKILDLPITMPMCNVLSISPEVKKQLQEQTATQWVTTNTISVNELAGRNPEDVWGPYDRTLHHNDAGLIVRHHSVPLWSINALVSGKRTFTCLLDSGAEIIGMQKDIWESLGIPLRTDHLMTMESANKTKNQTIGVIKNLVFNFGAGDMMFQVQVVETANFEILLGRPFHALTSCRSCDMLNGDLEITQADRPEYQERVDDLNGQLAKLLS
jgi:hypothetical protein